MMIGAFSEEVGARSNTKTRCFTTACLPANGWETLSAAVYCTLATHLSLLYFPAQT